MHKSRGSGESKAAFSEEPQSSIEASVQPALRQSRPRNCKPRAANQFHHSIVSPHFSAPIIQTDPMGGLQMELAQSFYHQNNHNHLFNQRDLFQAYFTRHYQSFASQQASAASSLPNLVASSSGSVEALQQFANLRNLSAVATALEQHYRQQQHFNESIGANGFSAKLPLHQLENQTNHRVDPQILGQASSSSSSSQPRQLSFGHPITRSPVNNQLTNESPAISAPPVRGRRNMRKCRKVYGVEQRHLWCTQCKWKKACTRFAVGAQL